MMRLNLSSSLETLENFNSDDFDVTTLLKLTNLRKLTACIRSGKFQDLKAIIQCLSITLNHLRHTSLDVTNYTFCSEEELTLLKQMLGCHLLYELMIKGVIGMLPEYCHFSPSLTVLTLKESELTEDPMATLEKLPNLRSLFLWKDSFVGKEMVSSAMGFPKLTSLTFWGLSNLDKRRVDEEAMPNLLYLQIGDWANLKMVPYGLRFVTTLQKLVISYMPEAFKNRLRVIDGEEGEDFYKVRHVPSVTYYD
uniref:Disease resistance R13L4/SHOC-2-like LRR domain-containing protein n=1 Tax=Davidia involucrata TaxID=16924 RepID=A0A5B7BSE6_DAVIN